MRSGIAGTIQGPVSASTAAAILSIKTNFGDVVAFNGRSVFKFGHTSNADQNVQTEVQHLPTATPMETDAVGNVIDTISSSNAGDNQDIIISGHTVSGGVFTSVAQTATLNGQNKVVLTTPLNKVSRAYNNNSSNLSGPIYVYEDDTVTLGVPDTDSKVHLIIAAGKNQSEKCILTMADNEYLAISSMAASVAKKTSANADLDFQIRAPGKVWRTQAIIGLQTGGTNAFIATMDPMLIVPKNYDVRIIAESSANDTGVQAWFNACYLDVVS